MFALKRRAAARGRLGSLRFAGVMFALKRRAAACGSLGSLRFAGVMFALAGGRLFSGLGRVGVIGLARRPHYAIHA